MEIHTTHTQKISYIFNGRFPSEKAHALYVAKQCESFCGLGFDVSIIAPRRFRNTTKSYGAFFGVQERCNVIYLPTIDIYPLRKFLRLAFLVNSVCFAVSVFFFTVFKSSKTNLFFAHDSFTCAALLLSRKRVVYEVHDYPDSKKIFFGFLFKKVAHVLTQNEWKKEKIVREFKVLPSKVTVEPNGVDFQKFSSSRTVAEARVALQLREEPFIVLYTGHLFDWKGAHILAQAASFLDAQYQVYFVGGSSDDVRRFREQYRTIQNITVVGYRPYDEIPLWLKAANCLVVPNTAKKDISKFYTAPMKFFEYLASERVVIASDLPSLRQLATDAEVEFVLPDDPESLAEAIIKVKNNYAHYSLMLSEASKLAASHSWDKRAVRIGKACGFLSL